MKTLNKICLAGLLLATTAASALAQDSKIGYINTQRVIAESAPAKAAGSKLEQEFSKRQKELSDLQMSLKSLSEKFERDAPTLTESQRSARQKEFAEQNRDFQRRQRELQEDLNSRRNEELLQVLEKAKRAVKSVAESEKYDLILANEGSEIVAYSNNKLDITDKVIKILNAGSK